MRKLSQAFKRRDGRLKTLATFSSSSTDFQMNRVPFALRTFTLLTSAVMAVLATSGGSAHAAAQSDGDQASASQLKIVKRIVRKVDAELRNRGLADTATAQSGSPDAGIGRFPGVVQTNLVANRPEFNPQIIDPDLLNPWGIAIRPAGFGGHFWFASAGSGKSLQYVGDVGGQPLHQDELKVVDTGGPASGTAFNPGTQFVITQDHPNGPITNPTKFFFAGLEGKVTAWTERQRADGSFDHPEGSVTVVDGTVNHSSFVGVAVSPAGDRLMAADFGAQPGVRVYDGSFKELAPLHNPFRAPGNPPGGFEAFNVQTLDQSVFVMYGRHVPPGTQPVPTGGRLAEFDAQGQLVATWAGRGHLNYPWGVAKAPQDFGLYSGCLLVGNFGDGTVVAFHPRHKVAIDYVRDDHGRRVVLDGLWGLQFGNGASLGEANHMYFAAGPNDEADGLVGKLQANPATWARLGGISLCR